MIGHFTEASVVLVQVLPVMREHNVRCHSNDGIRKVFLSRDGLIRKETIPKIRDVQLEVRMSVQQFDHAFLRLDFAMGIRAKYYCRNLYARISFGKSRNSRAATDFNIVAVGAQAKNVSFRP